MKPKQREGHPVGYYNYESDSGKKYSVVDFGTTMASYPRIENLRKAGLFLGWEAIELNEDGELMNDNLFQSDTWESLAAKLP